MNEIFSSIYEFGGLIPFYSTDLGDHLRGFDITCTGYVGTPWYAYIGWIMIGLTLLLYALMYHIIDSVHFNKKSSWWIMALLVVLINFFLAFSVSYNSVRSGDVCKSLHISFGDFIGFGFANATVAFILFLIITTIPWIRDLGTNCRVTTFWRP
jgi:hypothetical protein